MYYYYYVQKVYDTVISIYNRRTNLPNGDPPKSSFQSLSHGKITAICQGGLNKLVLNSKVLKAIVELGIGHVDWKLLKNIFLLRVKVEPHLTKPFKSPGTCDLCTDQLPCHITLMNMFK